MYAVFTEISYLLFNAKINSNQHCIQMCSNFAPHSPEAIEIKYYFLHLFLDDLCMYILAVLWSRSIG